jgi:hypothetical protein
VPRKVGPGSRSFRVAVERMRVKLRRDPGHPSQIRPGPRAVRAPPSQHGPDSACPLRPGIMMTPGLSESFIRVVIRVVYPSRYPSRLSESFIRVVD